MRNESRKIEYSIFYTVRSRYGAGVAFQSTKGQLRNNSSFFFPPRSIFAELCRFHRVASRAGLLAGPTRDTLQSYVTLARLALTSTSIGYRRSRRDRACAGGKMTRQMVTTQQKPIFIAISSLVHAL